MKRPANTDKMCRFKDSLIWYVLNLLPQNLISRLAGRVAQIEFPQPIMKWIIRGFVRKFDIDLNEVATPVEAFTSLQSFFIRKLSAGARGVDENPNSIVSPCDAVFGQSGIVERGTMLQVKGKQFSLADLITDASWSESFEGGTYAVLYLSPRDYHRFHAPMSMEINEAWHVPGRLWPVNLWAVRCVDRLFCVNERVVMKVSPKSQKSATFAIIAVGATMVGKIKLEFDNSLTTNLKDSRVDRRQYGSAKAQFAKGQELGRFEFGSTIVMIVPRNIGMIHISLPGTSVRMGQSIGIINES